MPKARVFVSMGQDKKSNEKQACDEIEKLLIGRGYEPYVAITEQSLLGLIEPILNALRKCEYFLFVDFYRDMPNPNITNVSLFSHQELAVAAALKKPFILAFRDERLGTDDTLNGMARYLKINPIYFNSKNDLIQKVQQAVEEQEKTGVWNTNWRNELVIEGYHGRMLDENTVVHLPIKNNHHVEAALSCAGFMTSAKKNDALLLNPRISRFPLVELKWEGIEKVPYVIIPPGKPRNLDGLVFHNNNDHYEVGRNDFSDTELFKFSHKIDKHESAILEFECDIVSLNFTTIKAIATIEFVPGKKACVSVKQIE